MTIRMTLALSALLLCSPLVHAHDEATMAAMKAPHGGQLKMAGWYHFELVQQGRKAVLYITDHAGVAKPSAGVKGELSTVSNGKTQTLTLSPAKPNLLQGQWASAPAKGATIQAKITFPDGRSEQTSFGPAAAMDHSQHH
ncbi:hypothetical protein [Chitinibacter tainanensis]|uniref:hypothetical protein n=1 Tax=Chitinibacter tainanensis TaxID=230667 RepID=UPI002352CC29|nr:hypothetical protein [Chitinibacter tainanensis]